MVWGLCFLFAGLTYSSSVFKYMFYVCASILYLVDPKFVLFVTLLYFTIEQLNTYTETDEDLWLKFQDFVPMKHVIYYGMIICGVQFLFYIILAIV